MFERLIILIVLIAIIFIIGFLYTEITSKIEAIVSDLKIMHSEVLKTKELLSNVTSLYEDKLNEESAKREALESKEEALENKIQSLEDSISILKEKAKQKGLVNPPYSELVQFIVEDRTDSESYIEENNRFVCTDFTNMFIRNFAKKGYFSCLTVISFSSEGKDMAHALVAVNTTDRGLVYVEPQHDGIIMNLKIGENYCSKFDWNCYWEIKNIKSCFNIGG